MATLAINPVQLKLTSNVGRAMKRFNFAIRIFGTSLKPYAAAPFRPALDFSAGKSQTPHDFRHSAP
jgi:hypothetical protein